MPEDTKAVEVNGREVVFREKLPAEQWWDILPELSQISEMAGAEEDEEALGAMMMRSFEWPTVVALITGTVETYNGEDLDGDELGEMDIFSELLPLLSAVAVHIGERTEGLGE